MQQLGEELLQVLEVLRIKMVIGLGEGAGANILARLALSYPDRVLGLILVHCTSTKAGIMEYFNDKVSTQPLKRDRGMAGAGCCLSRRRVPSGQVICLSDGVVLRHHPASSGMCRRGNCDALVPKAMPM